MRKTDRVWQHQQPHIPTSFDASVTTSRSANRRPNALNAKLLHKAKLPSLNIFRAEKFALMGRQSQQPPGTSSSVFGPNMQELFDDCKRGSVQRVQTWIAHKGKKQRSPLRLCEENGGISLKFCQFLPAQRQHCAGIGLAVWPSTAEHFPHPAPLGRPARTRGTGTAFGGT